MPEMRKESAFPAKSAGKQRRPPTPTPRSSVLTPNDEISNAPQPCHDPLFRRSLAADAVRVLETAGLVTWTGMLDPILRGVVRRRPDLALAAAHAWTSLVLPYYREPYYQESETGGFVEAAVAAAPSADLDPLAELLRQRIETEGGREIRERLLLVLLGALRARGASIDLVRRAIQRWHEEAPLSPTDGAGSSLDPYMGAETLAELSARLGSGEPDHWVTAAAERLISSAPFSEARAFADANPKLIGESRVTCALARAAAAAGEDSYARALLQRLRPRSEDRAYWDRWRGGTKLDYFRVLVELDGAEGRSAALNELADDLSAGREWLVSLLVELGEVLEVVAAAPDWPGIWDRLAEQLSRFREYGLGGPAARTPACPRTDEELIARLYEQAVSLQLFEPSRQVRIGAIGGLGAAGGYEIFCTLVDGLLKQEPDGPPYAIGLLGAAGADARVAARFAPTLGQMAAHPDFAVSVAAIRLARSWDVRAEAPERGLPSYYSILFDDTERGEVFRPPPTPLGLGAADDPLAWTWALERPIRLLSDAAGVTAMQVRRRCHQLIGGAGELGAIKLGPEHPQRRRLHELEMRLAFPRPYISASVRALRRVAAELMYAGRLKGVAREVLLHEIGFPAAGGLIMAPTERPAGLPRPSFDSAGPRDEGDVWIGAIEEDLRALRFGDETVLAEITRFERTRYGREFRVDRLRLHAMADSEFASIDEALDRLPPVLNLGSPVAAYRRPSRHLVARFVPNRMRADPGEPPVICPYWAARLNWFPHPRSPFVYRDSGGTVVARTIWWRDGSPRDVNADVFWGEGFLLLLTSAAVFQLEALIGELEIQICCWRSARPERLGERVIASQARMSGRGL